MQAHVNVHASLGAQTSVARSFATVKALYIQVETPPGFMAQHRGDQCIMRR